MLLCEAKTRHSSLSLSYLFFGEAYVGGSVALIDLFLDFEENVTHSKLFRPIFDCIEDLLAHVIRHSLAPL